MKDYINSEELCHICKKKMTTIHAEAAVGQQVYVCEKCLEIAKRNFIWICMQCGKVYIRPKTVVLKRMNNPAMKQAYQECEHMQIIQGIDACIECDTEGIMEYVAEAKSRESGGHC